MTLLYYSASQHILNGLSVFFFSCFRDITDFKSKSSEFLAAYFNMF